MKPIRLRPLLAAALALGALFLAAARTSAQEDATGFALDPGQLASDVAALTRAPHRLAGTEAAHAARAYVRHRLEAIGVAELREHPFLLAQTSAPTSTATLLDETEETLATLSLWPLRPNGFIIPATPPDGLTAPVVDLRFGTDDDFAQEVHGRIALLAWNSHEAWRRAFRLGARAVVFYAEGEPSSQHFHYTEALANFPRFYTEAGPEAFREARRVRLETSQTWESRPGANLYAYIPGTDPVFAFGSPETLVIGAALDSFGTVPRQAPGARGAANAAALLQLAAWLHAHPPRRNVLLVWWDNRARGHEGARHFYRALVDPSSDAAWDKRMASWENEQVFIEQLWELTGQDEPWNAEGPGSREFRQRLRIYANEVTATLRLERAELRMRLREEEGVSAAERAILEASEQQVEAENEAWNTVKRVLAQGHDPAPVRAELREAVAYVRSLLGQRRDELAVERAGLATDAWLRERLANGLIPLNTTLLAGDAQPYWGVVVGGHADTVRNPTDQPGLYSGMLAAFSQASAQLGPEALPGFLATTLDGTVYPPEVFTAQSVFTHAGEVGGRQTIPSVVLMTAQDPWRREGTPLDTAVRLNLANMAAQFTGMGRLMIAAADMPRFSQGSALTRDVRYVQPEVTAGGRLFGPRVLRRVPGSSVADAIAPGAVILVEDNRTENLTTGAMSYNPRKFAAFDNFMLLRANAQGAYAYGPAEPDARQMDGYAALFDADGRVLDISRDADRDTPEARLSLFAAADAWFLPPPAPTVQPSFAYNAITNSALDAQWSLTHTRDGVFFVYAEERIPAIKAFGQGVLTAFNIEPGEVGAGVSTAAGLGEGFPFAPWWTPLPSARQSAEDLVLLNGARRDLLSSRGIRDQSVADLQTLAATRLTESAEATGGEAEAAATASFMLSGNVYGATRATINDLVLAVLFLLGLTLPFAFAVERLLIGATNIYRQAAGFALIFVLTFFVLYLTHPAFAVAATPLIIFLGFVIVLLAGLVIIIIMQKFETELKALQGMAGTVHSADVSRLGTLMAAMAMGISTMRRRPLRTALTAITIVLLTFTLLTFASFGSRQGVLPLYEGPAPTVTGVTVQRPSLREMEPKLVEFVRDYVRDREYLVAPRYWLNPQTIERGRPPRDPGVMLSTPDLQHQVVLSGLLGLTAAERAQRHDWTGLTTAPGTDAPDGIWLSDAVASRLGLDVGDPVLLGGLELRLAGVLATGQMLRWRDFEGTSILPKDMRVTDATQAPSDDDSEAGAPSWSDLPADGVAIVDAATVQRLNGTLRQLNVYTPSVDEASALAEELATLLGLPVVGTRTDGVYTHVFGTVLTAAGWADLALPILLGGLVVFGTMLGSVADREKEIYTFSALGLAPAHVAGLFFAEALVFALVGGMGGYLFAQGVLASLHGLAGLGLIAPPEISYASLSAVLTLLVVMVVVLVSAIYPALKASRGANTGILKSWSLPEPEGDELHLTFPFTVSAYDFTGVVSFLREHFENHRDIGMGNLMVMETALRRRPTPEDPEALALEARMALAPFDLGVTQHFVLCSSPSEIEGIDEVKLEMRRLSGQPKDWQRLNKVLLNSLRRQFLLWRALPGETMDLYREKTYTTLKGEEAEQPREVAS